MISFLRVLDATIPALSAGRAIWKHTSVSVATTDIYCPVTG